MDLNGARPLAKSRALFSAGICAHPPWRTLDLISLDQLKSIIGTGKAAARLKQRLVRAKVMASTGRSLVQRPIFNQGQQGLPLGSRFRASLLEKLIDAPYAERLNKNK